MPMIETLDYDKQARVVMVWPEELKNMVRDKVGPRGLTGFVIEAVCAKLENPTEEDEALAQEVAAKQNLTPPENLGKQTREEIISSVMDPELQQAETEQRQHESEMVHTFQENQNSAKRDDLFAKLMAKTGGNLDGFSDLKLASEISQPDPKPMTELTEPVLVEGDTDVCPKCGDLLIDGECWSCS